MRTAARARTRTSPAGRRVRGTAGYTLLELIVVLVIIGVMAAVAAPMAIRGLGGAQAEATAREIAAALRQSRSQAIVSNLPSTFTLDTRERVYAVAGAGARALPADLELGLFTARSEQLAETAGRIRHFPDGSATGGEVTVADKGAKYHVQVDWLTGRVSIHAE